jgi:UPF0755 protein
MVMMKMFDKRRRRKILIALTFFLSGLYFVNAAFPFAGAGRPVIMVINPTDTISDIAYKLQQLGIVSNGFLYHLSCQATGCPTLQPGIYEIPQNSSFIAVDHYLTAGPNFATVSVQAGMSNDEVVRQISTLRGDAFATQFMDALRTMSIPGMHAASAEGLMGLGTYILDPTTTPEHLAAEIHQNLLDELKHAGIGNGTDTWTYHGLNAYQIFIGASLLQKEGYIPSNMTRVARVLYNRLDSGEPLQMDSTLLYGLGIDGGSVTPVMRQVRSAYNTYTSIGLPPTAICIPSTQAMWAILHPASGPWLFYVIIDRFGNEAFSTTYSQQLYYEQLAQSRGLSLNNYR